MSRVIRRWKRMPTADRWLVILMTLAMIAVGGVSAMGLADSYGMVDWSKAGYFKPAQ